MQPQGHVQCWCASPTTSRTRSGLRRPRFRWVQGMQVSCEEGFPQSTLDELRRRGTTCSPSMTTTVSVVAKRFGASMTGILRPVIRAATVKPWPSRSGSCPPQPIDRCRFGNGCRAIESNARSHRRARAPQPGRHRRPPPTAPVRRTRRWRHHRAGRSGMQDPISFGADDDVPDPGRPG